MSEAGAGTLRVQLLGPVRAWQGEQELGLGGPRRRAVLAMLATRANHVVSRNELIDGLWGERPPTSAVNSVHVHVAGLRQVLEPRRARRAAGQVLSASGSGYELRLEPAQPDTQLLNQHLARARQILLAGDLPAAARALDAALGLWHGTELAGITGPWSDIERTRLGELRLTAAEERIDAMLALGGHQQAVAHLAGLMGEHPLHERFRYQHMLALYRSHRQADALAAFADARRTLDGELGIEPGPALRRLHQQILTADPALVRPAEDGSPRARAAVLSHTARPGPPIPWQLPADVDAFVGRADELAGLDRLWPHGGPGRPAQPGDRPPVALISAVAGSPGVGKTSLVVHWAHRARARFPDGQLYLNLRGYDPGEPVAANDALAWILRAFGVTGHDLPADVDERAAMYRSLLDGRRLLVVLDNAASVEQVRPLLPGTPSCAVIVTSRDSLAGLVARHGARRFDLDLLPPGDAVALLRALIGARVDADPVSAATLAGQCARLPLALRVAAELTAARPNLSLAQLVGELADEQRRLELLDAGGDPRSAVGGVFSWSYRHLPADARRAFRLIGLHAGPDLDVYAASALTGGTLERARDSLDRLVRAHLISRVRSGRYCMHDLLRAYARHLAAVQGTAASGAAGGEAGDIGPEGRDALTRLFDYYIVAATAAVDTDVLALRNHQPRLPAQKTPVPLMADSAAARAWVDAEWAALVAASYAAARGWPGHATRLSAIMMRVIEISGHFAEAVSVHDRALQAARRTGDRAAEAYALNGLGVVERKSRHPQAATHLQQAVTLFRELGDQYGMACALTNLGSCDWRLGRYGQAAAHDRQALALFRQIGDRRGEARALKGLGRAESRPGRYRQAASHLGESLVLYRALGDQSNEARVLSSLATVAEHLGRGAEAADYLRQAVAVFHKIGDRAGSATALTTLASITP